MAGKSRIDHLQLVHATNGIYLEYTLITDHGQNSCSSYDYKKELFEFDGKDDEKVKKAAIDRLCEMYKIHMKNPMDKGKMDKAVGSY